MHKHSNKGARRPAARLPKPPKPAVFVDVAWHYDADGEPRWYPQTVPAGADPAGFDRAVADWCEDALRWDDHARGETRRLQVHTAGQGWRFSLDDE